MLERTAFLFLLGERVCVTLRAPVFCVVIVLFGIWELLHDNSSRMLYYEGPTL